jgi:peptidoglycan hydrolase-like protein with peptidoglycan-binding domain
MIEEIQNILMRAGFDPGAIDGKMTWQTREALKEFQKANSLKKTGYVNTETRVKLDSYRIETEAQPAPLPGVPVEQAPPTLSIPAAQGETITADIIRQRLMLPEWVKKIQQALNDAGFAAGPADGKMGGKTKSALIEFQKSKGLTSDGVVGVRTWEELSKFFPSSSSGPAAVQMPQAEAVAGRLFHPRP